MKVNTLTIGTIGGIKVRLHWTWVIVFVLVTWSLAVGYFPQNFPHWSTAAYWVVSAAAAILLFGTVLIHELSHSLLAKKQGLPVDSITLYVFGGVSNLSREPDSAGEEFWIAIAGPLASIALGLIFLGLHAAVRAPGWLAALFGYLGVVNLTLAFFNLLPAFPLDGGRVLRAAVWAITHDLRRATLIATGASEVVALIFILVGIWIASTVDVLSGVWLALIGWFIFNAAVSYRRLSAAGPLAALHVADVMTPDPAVVSPETQVDVAVQEYLLQQDEQSIPVVTNGKLLGLLSVDDVRHFPPEQWSTIPASQAMTPIDRLDTVSPDLALTEALRLMEEHHESELPVTQNGRLVGLLSSTKTAHYLQVRRELGLDGGKARVDRTAQSTAA